MTESELDEALAELEGTCEIAQKELETLQRSAERAAELERDKDILLERIASTAPERIDCATPEERHQACRTLQLSVSVHADRPLEVSGAFTDVLDLESTSSPYGTTTCSWC
jgi:CBS-domain-containing membrane protein